MRALFCSYSNKNRILEESGSDFFSTIVIVDNISIEWINLDSLIECDFESVFIDTQSLYECGISPEATAWAITQLLHRGEMAKVLVDEHSGTYFHNLKGFMDASRFDHAGGGWYELRQTYASTLQVESMTVGTEDAELSATGGIGTFNWHLRRISGGLVGSIVIGPPNSKELQFSIDNGVVQFSGKLGSTFSEPELGELAIKAVLQSLAIGPKIRGILIQDYQSMGFRLAQARVSGLLPPWLSITLVMHGQADYLLNARGDWPVLYGKYEVFEAVKTQYALREADSIIFPSNFLRDLLMQTYEIDDSRTVTMPLPYDLDVIDNIVPSQEQQKFDYVYIGKQSNMKGWPVITEFLSLLRQEPRAELSKVLLLMPETNNLHWKRRNKLFVEQRYVQNRDLLSISKSNSTALYLLPHAFENYPYAFLEQVLLGNQILTIRQGGGWELIQRFQDEGEVNVLTARDFKEFLQIAKERKKNWPSLARQNDRARSLQKRFNKAFLNHVLNVHRTTPTNDSTDLPTIDVVTPVFNTNSAHLAALEISLASQKSQFSTWIIVDDGSSSPETIKAIDRLSALTWTKVVKQVNAGLSSARNRGFTEVSSKLVLFMDSDDICLPRMLRAHRLAHYLSPEYGAFGGISAFVPSDDLDKRGRPVATGRFAPLGTELAVHLQFFGYNQYLTANSSFSRLVCGSLLRFNSERNGIWEDWELFHKLSRAGTRIGIIPEELFIYRVRADSMTRSANRKMGVERMVSANGHLLGARIAMSIASMGFDLTNFPWINLHPIAALVQRIAIAHENRILGKIYRGFRFAVNQISPAFKNLRN